MPPRYAAEIPPRYRRGRAEISRAEVSGRVPSISARSRRDLATPSPPCAVLSSSSRWPRTRSSRPPTPSSRGSDTTQTCDTWTHDRTRTGRAPHCHCSSSSSSSGGGGGGGGGTQQQHCSSSAAAAISPAALYFGPARRALRRLAHRHVARRDILRLDSAVMMVVHQGVPAATGVAPPGVRVLVNIAGPRRRTYAEFVAEYDPRLAALA